MLHLIDTTPDAAENALMTIAGHVPVDVEIGRPKIARGGSDDGGLELITVVDEEPIEWFVWPDRVQRYRENVGGRGELVEYADGGVRSRTIGALQG